MGERIAYVPITEHYTHMIPVDLDERWDDDETPTWDEILAYVDEAGDLGERLPSDRPPAPWWESMAGAWVDVEDLTVWELHELTLATADSRRWLGERVLISLGCPLEVPSDAPSGPLGPSSAVVCGPAEVEGAEICVVCAQPITEEMPHLDRETGGDVHEACCTDCGEG